MKAKILILGMLLIAVSGCGMKETEKVETEKVMNASEKEIEKIETEGKKIEANNDKMNVTQWPIAEENIKNINDTVEVPDYDGIEKSVTVLNVTFSKEYSGNKFENYQKELLNTIGAQYDENGNLLDDHIYMNMEIQVTNHEGESEWNAAEYPVVLLKEDRTLLNVGDGPIWIHCDELVKGYDQKDCLFIPFKSEESKIIHIIYAMKESAKDNGWGWFVSITSTWFPEENSYFIKL